MGQLGIGVMLNYLGGNEETVAAIKASIGNTITSVVCDTEELRIGLSNDTTLVLWDNGQSCCESRYMSCADDLESFIGDKLVDIELKDAPSIENDEYVEHDIQFLDIITDKSRFQISNHNEHNGYYGGFSISAKLM
jgi:hypothetical protein